MYCNHLTEPDWRFGAKRCCARPVFCYQDLDGGAFPADGCLLSTGEREGANNKETVALTSQQSEA